MVNRGGNSRTKTWPFWRLPEPYKMLLLQLTAACPQERATQLTKNVFILSGSGSWLHVSWWFLNSTVFGCPYPVSKRWPFSLAAASFPCASQDLLPALKPNPGFPHIPVEVVGAALPCKSDCIRQLIMIDILKVFKLICLFQTITSQMCP